MKTITSLCYTLSIALLLAMASPLAGQDIYYSTPARFGVIDITPTNLSGEISQNSEPSLGVGTGPKYGKTIVHAFFGNYYYTSDSTGGPEWTTPGTVADRDATLDWSVGGNCYMAMMPTLTSIEVRASPDPANTTFSAIAPGSLSGSPDQPWVKVVNVTNVDHIYVGFNDLGHRPKSASVRYSLDGGANWRTTVIEKVSPGAGQDLPSIRLATSSDGSTVYALFQRLTSSSGSDFNGAVVLVRDDSYGGNGYGALGGGNGTAVASSIVLPWGTALGAQRLGGTCALTLHPTHPSTVYVAYTEVLNSQPVLRVQGSVDSGAGFNLLCSITNASLPELAVTRDGTVGLLYASKNGTDLEVHFSKAFDGNFASRYDRILAVFPDNNPVKAYDPYIGDYFTLRAVNYDFFGTFCASGDPKPSHFPSGVYFQRNVNVQGTIKKEFWLSAPGTLVDLNGHTIAPSIDPFVFYDIAPTFGFLPRIYLVPPFLYDPIDPFGLIPHLSWPVLPWPLPQPQLQGSPALGSGADWTPATNNTIVQVDGQFLAPIIGPQDEQYYRLVQDVGGAQFQIFAAAGANGSLSPSGILTNTGLQDQIFTATPDSDHAIGTWYLDGAAVQTGGDSLVVSNIADEHILTVTFVASNDLAVAVAELRPDEEPTVTFKTNSYVIDIENKGLNSLTGVSMLSSLPPNVDFVSASTSQGTVNESFGEVTADIGSLSPGALVTVTIFFVPLEAGSITNTVEVACNEFEPDIDNNTAIDITTVLDRVMITNPPASQVVPVGGTAVFSVGVSGTPPFEYQWFFNGTNIVDATNSLLTLSTITVEQAGSYSVSVFQVTGPEDVVEEESDAALLTVGTALIAPSPSPAHGKTPHARRIR